MGMNTRQFIKTVRKIGKANGVSVDFDARKGKGSHGTLYYGDKLTTVPNRDELGIGLLKAMAKDLGLENEF
jgi:mRNA interferase HicA